MNSYCADFHLFNRLNDVMAIELEISMNVTLYIRHSTGNVG